MKRTAKVLLLLIGITAVGLVGLQYYAQHRLDTLLSEGISPDIRLHYDKATVNILSRSITVHQLHVKTTQSASLPLQMEGRIEKLQLSGLGAWSYLVQHRVKVARVEMTSPHITLHQEPLEPKMDTLSKKKPFDPISLGQFKITNGSVRYLKGDATHLRADSLQLSVRQVEINQQTLQHKIPFQYGPHKIQASRFYVDLGPYEKLDVEQLRYTNGDLKLSNLKLQSKYGKRELSRILPKERDHFSLQVPEIRFRDIAFGYQNDRFFLRSPFGNIKGTQLEIYRDKLVADDLQKKALYSKTLRELPIDLQLDTINISDAFIGYEELVDAKTHAGRIFFERVDATLENISNTYGKGERTTIDAQALFMGNAPMELNWSFDTNDVGDNFKAKGSFTNFRPESVNSFLESNLRIRATGFVEKIYFTFGGNGTRSSGDLKMKYRDFDFQILKKDRLGVNKLFTALGRIFVNDGSKTDAEGFGNGEIKAERDPTKSFFNYLWINVRAGIVSTLTGKAEKKA